ncbi:hypothetical protein [Agromyces atrinae]|uniref:Uncharacterized protein n=1 Tax=Agromyces atrinae TaxID=592376 RepID=A0A4Q2M4U0_9MICO|nr:hypothetical protein [Agromyces atrinae]NYD66424.1 hypothetical protein [Agromyces atrinae]RXZ87104.1 hypothetical protein ESP50_04040 [Agromyces atrinae]
MIAPVELAPVLSWIVLVIAVSASATIAVFSFYRPNRALTWISAVLLGASLLVAALVPEAPPASITVYLSLASLAIAIFGGGPAAVLALDLAMRGSVQAGAHGGILVMPASTAPGVLPERREVLRGGTTIGILERIATAGAILLGFPEALAIVVAVKGVGRFTELEAAESRERFIIGTLASLIWACAAAILVRLASS